MTEDTIQRWDDLWKERGESKPPLETDEWVSLVWKVGLEYWQELFGKYAPGKKLLECGAGSAQLSVYMAKLGYECTMLDNSEEGLRAGKTTFDRDGMKGTFFLGDVEKMAFPDDSFDIVYSGGLLEHFTDVRPPIKEMVRVLRPGGLFAATIIPKRFSCQSLGYASSFLVQFIRHIVALRFRGSIRESRRNFPFYENSISLKEYKKAMAECGLQDVGGGGTGPYPALPLPKSWRHLHVLLMKRSLPLWRKFDRSNSWFTEIWGDSFSVYGVKKRE